MKKLLMITAGIFALSSYPALAQQDDGSSDDYQAAYFECSKLADEQGPSDDNEASVDWDYALSECLQEKGFTAPNEDEHSPEDFPADIMPDDGDEEDVHDNTDSLEDTSY